MTELPPKPESSQIDVHCAACIQEGKATIAKWLTAEGHLLCEKHKDIEWEATVRKRMR